MITLENDTYNSYFYSNTIGVTMKINIKVDFFFTLPCNTWLALNLGFKYSTM